jgi:hypothetical protein
VSHWRLFRRRFSGDLVLCSNLSRFDQRLGRIAVDPKIDVSEAYGRFDVTDIADATALWSMRERHIILSAACFTDS